MLYGLVECGQVSPRGGLATFLNGRTPTLLGLILSRLGQVQAIGISCLHTGGYGQPKSVNYQYRRSISLMCGAKDLNACYQMPGTMYGMVEGKKVGNDLKRTANGPVKFN